MRHTTSRREKTSRDHIIGKWWHSKLPIKAVATKLPFHTETVWVFMMLAEIGCWGHYCVHCFGDVLMSSALTFRRNRNKGIFSLLFRLQTRCTIALVIETGLSCRRSRTYSLREIFKLRNTSGWGRVCLHLNKEIRPLITATIPVSKLLYIHCVMSSFKTFNWLLNITVTDLKTRQIFIFFTFTFGSSVVKEVAI